MLIVDQEKCIGCGTCIAMAGKTFKFNESGKAEIINPEGDDAETIKSAADACPVQAITL